MTRGAATVSAASGALLWGTLGPVVSAWSTLGGAETAFARSLAAALTLGVVARGAVAARAQVREYFRSLLVGGAGLAGFQFAYFAAVAESGVAVSTVIGIGLAPAITGAWSWITSSRPSATWMVGTGLASVGLVLLVLGSALGATVSPAGIGWSVLAAVFFSAQALAIESVGARWSNPAVLTSMFLIAAIVMVPIGGPVLWRSGALGAEDVLVIAYVGVVTAGLAYWLFAAGVAVLGAAVAVTISLLEPVGAIMLAVLFLREGQSLVQWLGIVLLIACIPVTAYTPKKVASIPAMPEPAHR
ncbi:EamA family transporter [Rhodococcus sp. JS3073]|uniref:EamA family transporter n=1 Tax=Rhodococcus sp. JS3073 TaxID=3002901 RepID=UPI002286972A|nr:DMT family transporter [Rhodococcus sp. JS3073]WAM19903.1 DMT family transporter [Rhodococcus sp. JS3073]